MKKAELIQMILDDMKAKQSPYNHEDVEKEYGGYLRRAPKAEVEHIAKNRGLLQDEPAEEETEELMKVLEDAERTSGRGGKSTRIDMLATMKNDIDMDDPEPVTTEEATTETTEEEETEWDDPEPVTIESRLTKDELKALKQQARKLLTEIMNLQEACTATEDGANEIWEKAHRAWQEIFEAYRALQEAELKA